MIAACRSCARYFETFAAWQRLCPICWQRRREETDRMRNAPIAPKGITLDEWIVEDPRAVADHVGGEWL